FEGNAGDNIFIRSVTRGVDIRLSLLQDSEVLVESTDRIELSLPVSGSYRVRVDYVAGIGEYDIGLGYTDRDNPNDTGATAIPQVVGVPTPTAPVSAPGSFIRALDENAEISDTLTDTARQHIYTLSGTQGSVINLELYQVSGELDPVLRLFDAEGNLLAMDDNSLGGQNARLLNVRLPETATYSIQVDGKERT
ncbi:MAG: pre-peptidase C-terminal domain-containing protein, partial [Chloroflexota bacterium]